MSPGRGEPAVCLEKSAKHTGIKDRSIPRHRPRISHDLCHRRQGAAHPCHRVAVVISETDGTPAGISLQPGFIIVPVGGNIDRKDAKNIARAVKRPPLFFLITFPASFGLQICYLYFNFNAVESQGFCRFSCHYHKLGRSYGAQQTEKGFCDAQKIYHKKSQKTIDF